MAKPKDITWRNNSLPVWPDGMNIFQKIACLFGYHKWEPRQIINGEWKGMKLRDQCGRCGTLK